MRLLSALVAFAAIASPSLAKSPFTSGKVSISTLDGSSRLSESFSPRTTPIEALSDVRLDSDELIRVSFNVGTEGDEGESATTAPSQLAIQLQSTTDPSRIFSWSVAPIKSTGKVTWSQRVDRLPLQRLSSQDPTFILRLLVAGKQDALALQLGTLTIPYLRGARPSATPERYRLEEELGFHRWEEKRHTFRKEITEGMPGAKKSVIVAVILVVIPWLVLSGLLLPLINSSSLQLTTPKLPTSILFASLLFLEVIGLRYYKGDFILFKMLPLFIAGAAVASVAVLAGGVRGVGLIGGK